MPEKPGGMAEAPNAEDVKKRWAAELEREIHQKKQYLAVMVEDKGEWLACKRYVDMLRRQFSNDEFDPAAEKKKQEQLAKYQGELKQIEGECYGNYKTQHVLALGSAISNCGNEIAKKQETLQIYQRKPYVFGQQAGQSQQGQDDHVRQQVKDVAEPQAEFLVGKKKNNETPEPPDERVQNHYTALTVTTFQSHREMLKQGYKLAQEQGRERDCSPRGRDM